jgi:hypothetical protein
VQVTAAGALVDPVPVLVCLVRAGHKTRHEEICQPTSKFLAGVEAARFDPVIYLSATWQADHQRALVLLLSVRPIWYVCLFIRSKAIV